MGVSCSCPFAGYFDLDNGFESIVVNSKKVGYDEQNSPIQLLGCGPRKTQTMRFNEDSSSMEMIPNSPTLDPNSPKHEAALKLQKVYKSFRTRRKLADCAVLIEQSWWKLLDFAELKHSSISFFDVEKHETAISRWSRARTRAAKVGKGLSKNCKAQKLALQHWLEAIDPRHRYGHNLHFYYVKWLNSQSKEPFFYWIDIGEGKEVNLIDKCPRLKLQQQCIKYLGPMERKAYEVAVEDGKLLYSETGEVLNTINEPKGCKWIFVLSTSKTLYVGKKRKGSFQHSSFLAGGATLAAGRVVAENGVLKAVWPHSGHYKPTPENFQDFISFMRENNVDLTDVKLDSIDEEEQESSVGKHLRNNSSGDDLTIDNDTENKAISEEPTIDAGTKRTPHSLVKLMTLKIPSKDGILERLKSENELISGAFLVESPKDGYMSAEESFASSKHDDQEEEEEEETIPEECILERINSHKETKSFQLGKQLSCKWSTGAGPRISCLRDYPSGLQCHALEQVNLSPRSKRSLRFDFPSTPTGSHLSRTSSHNPGGTY